MRYVHPTPEYKRVAMGTMIESVTKVSRGDFQEEEEAQQEVEKNGTPGWIQFEPTWIVQLSKT
jgi:hypothetical protein